MHSGNGEGRKLYMKRAVGLGLRQARRAARNARAAGQKRATKAARAPQSQCAAATTKGGGGGGGGAGGRKGRRQDGRHGPGVELRQNGSDKWFRWMVQDGPGVELRHRQHRTVERVCRTAQQKERRAE